MHRIGVILPVVLASVVPIAVAVESRLATTVQAIDRLTSAIGTSPSDSTLYIKRAIELARLGMYDDSIRDCTAAITLQPEDADHWRLRALMFIEKREYTTAIKDLTNALKLKPNEPTLHYLRGKAELKNRNPTRAIGHMREAVKHFAADSPHLTETQLRLAEALGLTNRSEEAAKLVDSVIERLPRHTDARVLRAQMRMTRQPHAAIEDFNVAIEEAPDRPDLYLGRATVLVRVGRKAEAERDAEKSRVLTRDLRREAAELQANSELPAIHARVRHILESR